MTKADHQHHLYRLLTEVIGLHSRGGRYSDLARLQREVDDYMEILLDEGSFSMPELVALVGQARSAANGPATARLRMDSIAPAA